jgi:hypothetical protein
MGLFGMMMELLRCRGAEFGKSKKGFVDNPVLDHETDSFFVDTEL